MLNDVVLLIVGGIGGVMSKRAVSATAKALGTPAPPSPAPSTPAPVAAPVAPSYGQSNTWVAPSGALPEWVNPPLDESWTPGPPPTTPPDHLEDDHDRAQLAAARQETQ